MNSDKNMSVKDEKYALIYVGGIELLIVFVTVKGEYADCAVTGRMVAA